MNTKTPITDAAQFRHHAGGIDEPPGTIWVVEADVAAGLERKNAALLAALESIRAVVINAEPDDPNRIEQVYQLAGAAIRKATPQPIPPAQAAADRIASDADRAMRILGL